MKILSLYCIFFTIVKQFQYHYSIIAISVITHITIYFLNYDEISYYLYLCSIQAALGSYLDYPRLHFYGHFRADSCTRNNDRCNYRMDKAFNPDLNGADWGFNGTNEFHMYDVRATSVVYKDGTNSTTDSVIGHRIIDNLKRSHAKLTDLDTDIQDHSTIYGMNFGIKWGDKSYNEDVAFYGKWTRNVIAQHLWPRLKCYSDSNHGQELYQDSFPLGAQFTTTVTDIDWADIRDSQILLELKNAANGGSLAVRGTLHYYTRNYPSYVPFNATLGYIYGVIGVPGPTDTLNVPGQRMMSFNNAFPTQLNFDSQDLCQGQVISDFGPWLFNAPFEVDQEKNIIHLDLSNSLSSDLHDDLRDIGVLRVGILRNDCVLIISDDLSYRHQINLTSGVHDISIDSSLVDELKNYPLVLGQYLDNTGGNTPICGEFLIREEQNSHTFQILLQENEYFVRPKGYYVDRLDRVDHPSTTIQLYVTRYGQPVAKELEVKSPFKFIPENGIVATSLLATSNSDGIADFEFHLQENVPIPKMRQYGTPQCTEAADPSLGQELPIDGQVYNFTYCVSSSVDSDCNADYIIAFLAFSDVEEVDDPTWVDDIGPILTQYARLTPIMSTILNMSSYHDVTQAHNINLLIKSLTMEFEDPSYMPTTRDLSPAKKNMIIKWLNEDKPKYSSDDETPREDGKCVIPPVNMIRLTPPSYSPVIVPWRCNNESLQFSDPPQSQDRAWTNIALPSRFLPKPTLHDILKKRPLFRMPRRYAVPDYLNISPYNDPDIKTIEDNKCNLNNLKGQLQTAIQLEWATLPTYLTSLYSIVDGCNTEVYQLIRDVVMQEMLHFMISANILIALDGSPKIDSADFAPSYPTFLPGNVLLGLLVNLEKVSINHIHDIFMGIELPSATLVGGSYVNDYFTIGKFYEEIEECIEDLGDDVFDESTVDRQVEWPWNSGEVGTVNKITDVKSAKEAISLIISQGEGADELTPEDIEKNSIAHFFKFEEIVCKKHLKKISEYEYSYSGAPIEFNDLGIWPMRANPSVNTLIPDTNCYTEAKVFHQVYRNLLRKLQEVFNGKPEEISETVNIMESLQVHAKLLMWTKYNPHEPDSVDLTTCGPVWEYNWPGNDH